MQKSETHILIVFSVFASLSLFLILFSSPSFSGLQSAEVNKEQLTIDLQNQLKNCLNKYKEDSKDIKSPPKPSCTGTCSACTSACNAYFDQYISLTTLYQQRNNLENLHGCVAAVSRAAMFIDKVANDARNKLSEIANGISKLESAIAEKELAACKADNTMRQACVCPKSGERITVSLTDCEQRGRSMQATIIKGIPQPTPPPID